MDRATFEALVAEAISGLPEEFGRRLRDVVVIIEDQPDAATLREVGLDPKRDTLFGLYDGVPLSERGDNQAGNLPDRIVIYYRPLVQAFRTRARLEREIQKTIIHEVAHFFGMDDDEVDRLGYR